MAKKFLFDLNLGGCEIQNAVVQNLASAPSNPKTGQQYYNTSDGKLYVYNGTVWVDITGAGATYTFSTGLTETSGTVTLNKATSSALGGVIADTNISVDADGKISVKDASTSDKGVIQLAQASDITTGTDTSKAVTPKLVADTFARISQIGTAGSASVKGIAELDTNGKVPVAQLPSFVDDVVDSYIVGSTPLAADWLSETAGGSPLTPEGGKIYVVLTSGEYQNKTFRWSGSTYVEISPSPGQATSTAAGIMKLYDTVGTNTDGTMTQNSLKTTFCQKLTAQNTALTPASGIATWTISNTLGTADVLLQVKEVSTNEVVEVASEITSTNVIIKINSISDIAADTYRAIIIG